MGFKILLGGFEDLFGIERFVADLKIFWGIKRFFWDWNIYFGVKDSALVSTFSGRLALRIKEDSEEKLITKINDEIYALEYSEKRKEIIAATNSQGVLVIDSKTGKIKHKLNLSGEKWTLNIFFSDDENKLYAFDLNGVNHIWNAQQNYHPEPLPKNFPESYLRVTKENKLYSSSRGKISVWDKKENKLIKESKTKGTIKDVDKNDQ